MEPAARICLGSGAPEPVASLLAALGIELVPLSHRHRASLYVDFIGARPGDVALVSIDVAGKAQPRPKTDLHCDDPVAIATFVLSRALALKAPLISGDEGMFAAIRTALGVATSRVPVVLEGESGTGKELLAELVHRASHRTGTLVALDCAAVDDDQIDAELAGPIGLPATEPREGGRMALADGGTLYIDQISQLSPLGQARLLAAIRQADEPVAGAFNAPIASQLSGVRYVAATSRSLAPMVEHGEFRSDLYWTLNVFSVALPALRDRAGDAELLARHFLRGFNPRRQFTPSASRMLADYPFPGNVRELMSAAARLAVVPLASGADLIDTADVRAHLLAGDPRQQPIKPTGWKDSREAARREMVLRTIAACGGDRAAAARRLRITPRALQYHITKAGLSRPRALRRSAESSPAAPSGGS